MFDKPAPFGGFVRPVVAYHGTQKAFVRHDVRFLGSNADLGNWGPAAYLTGDTREAATYAMRMTDPFSTDPALKPAAGANIRQEAIAFKNPLEINQGTPEGRALMDALGWEPTFGKDAAAGAAFRQRVLDAGYDGLVLTGPYRSAPEYVVYNPKTISPYFGPTTQEGKYLRPDPVRYREQVEQLARDRAAIAGEHLTFAGLAGKHRPLIEGLRHGGLAEKIRKVFTSFGSGWRGLVSVDQGWGLRLLGPRLAGTPPDLSEIKQTLTGPAGRQMPTALRLKLGEAVRWSERTGRLPVLVNADRMSGIKFRRLALILRHERIHSVHMPNVAHPFFQQELGKTGSFEQAIAKGSGGILRLEAEALGLNPAAPEVIRAIQTDLPDRVTQITNAYRRLYEGSGPEVYDYERLAWANEMDRGFFRRAEQAGIRDPRKVTQAVMKTGASQAMAQAGTGWVSKIVHGARRMLRSV